MYSGSFKANIHFHSRNILIRRTRKPFVYPQIRDYFVESVFHFRENKEQFDKKWENQGKFGRMEKRFPQISPCQNPFTFLHE